MLGEDLALLVDDPAGHLRAADVDPDREAHGRPSRLSSARSAAPRDETASARCP